MCVQESVVDQLETELGVAKERARRAEPPDALYQAIDRQNAQIADLHRQIDILQDGLSEARAQAAQARSSGHVTNENVERYREQLQDAVRARDERTEELVAVKTELEGCVRQFWWA